MLRLIDAHNLSLSKQAIQAFWEKKNSNELISINGSDYQITNYVNF